MDSSSILRMEAAADAAEAEVRVLTWKRYAEAKMKVLEAELAAEQVKIENEAAIAKARYHAMKAMMDKIRTESDYLVNENSGKLCRNSKMEKICPSSGQAGHSRKTENHTQSHSAGKWLGQVSESRVLQTQSESAQEIQEMNETEIRKIEIKKKEEMDDENVENVLNLGQLKSEVENRITEMKMEIQSRKRIAEIRRVELQGAISRRKRDAENSRRKRSGENSRKNSEEENSRRNMEKAQKSRNLKKETQNSNIERTRSKLEVEENEQSCRWDSSLITEILVDEMPSLENLEVEVAEIGPQNYRHPFFDDDWSGAVTGTEEKATKNDDLYLKNSEKKNQEQTKIEKANEERNEENKAENEAGSEEERDEEKVKKHEEENMKQHREEKRPHVYRAQYREKRKRPTRNNLKNIDEERPTSTMKRFLFNRLRPPETRPRRGQGEGLCQQTSSRHL